MNLTGEKVLIGLSGGINSMAVLCWLVESGMKPKELHLYYAHFLEHSPDTFQFVADGIRYARKHFDNVKVKITKHSILQYFAEKKLIPHPTVSPCSRQLKIEPIGKYAFDNGVKYDLIGYVKEELKRRASRQFDPQLNFFEADKFYAIGDFSNEWCFDIVEKHLGWYPFIYTIRNADGERIFKHNNCLPCKNMSESDIEKVRTYYNEYYLKAIQLSALIGSYWGRDEAEFYSRFGRELGQESTCETCKW